MNHIYLQSATATGQTNIFQVQCRGPRAVDHTIKSSTLEEQGCIVHICNTLKGLQPSDVSNISHRQHPAMCVELLCV